MKRLNKVKDTKHRPKGLLDRQTKTRARAQVSTSSKSTMIFFNVIKKHTERTLTHKVILAAAAKAMAQRVRLRMGIESITTKPVMGLTKSD